MGIIMLIFWIIVFTAAFPLISGVVSNRSSAFGKKIETPVLDILEQRCARGEIDQEMYEAVKPELL